MIILLLLLSHPSVIVRPQRFCHTWPQVCVGIPHRRKIARSESPVGSFIPRPAVSGTFNLAFPALAGATHTHHRQYDIPSLIGSFCQEGHPRAERVGGAHTILQLNHLAPHIR